MKVTILKEFPYAHDGNKSEVLAVGEEREVRDALVPGLAAAGYVAKPVDQKSFPGIEPSPLQHGPIEGKALVAATENMSEGSAPDSKCVSQDTVSQRTRRRSRPTTRA